MKTKIFLLGVVVFLMSTLSVVASRPPVNKSDDFLKEIDYPTFAKENKIEGVVLVSLFINKTGNISVDLANASNDDLKEYVVKKLKNIVVKDDEMKEKNMNFKFVFKLL